MKGYVIAGNITSTGYRNLIGKYELIQPEGPTISSEVNFRMDLKERGSVWNAVMGSCEHSNEPPGSMKVRNLLTVTEISKAGSSPWK
jgi:hypothetical protein